MSRLRKFLPAMAVIALLTGVVAASLWPSRGQVPVEIAPVERKDLLSTVRATGQIVPSSYVNVLGQGYGRVTDIVVREGQFVRPGDLLLKVDSVQVASNVRALQAAFDLANSGLRVAQAAVESAQARVSQQEAALEKARYDREQEEKLYQARVIPRKTVESYRTAYNDAQALLTAARAQLAQALAEQVVAQGKFSEAQSKLVHAQDVLNKTSYYASMAGTVTNIAVRVGENVIPGVPQSVGAYLMTISNMSSARAEVRAHQTEIPDIHNGEPVTVQIDAFPGRTFAGRVVQVGAQAILSTSGMATSQVIGGGSAQEATDYKVDIELDDPPKGLLPGMTITSVIQTAHKKNVVAVPFQSLVLRPKDEAGRTSVPGPRTSGPVQLTATPAQQGQPANKGEQGVFVVRSGRAIFEPVQIGILGETDIEVLKGVKAGEEIVTGDYTALQRLHSGMRVRIVKAGQ